MTGPDHLGNDFGNYQNGTKSGTKFEDTNGNGVRNTGEPGLAGVEIHLFGTDGLGRAVHEHAITDANGNYSISVPPGNYTACETRADRVHAVVPDLGAELCGPHRRRRVRLHRRR